MQQWSPRIQIDGSNRIDPANLQQTAPNTLAQTTAYENHMALALTRISGNPVGAALLGQVNSAPFGLMIGPPLNSAIPITIHQPPGSWLSGVPIQAGAPRLGAGGGALQIILMPLHPAISATGIHRGADDVLVHELMHAVRGLFGRLTMFARPKGDFGDVEEFFAILVENMFASARGSRWMRVRHSPTQPVPRGFTQAQRTMTTTGALGMLRVSSEFVLDNPDAYTIHPRPTLAQQWSVDFRDWIDLFRKAESALAGRLSGLDIFFNPLRVPR